MKAIVHVKGVLCVCLRDGRTVFQWGGGVTSNLKQRRGLTSDLKGRGAEPYPQTRGSAVPGACCLDEER